MGISLTPHLDAEVVDAIGARLADNWNYFEWGCGGSTMLAVQSGAHSVISVESDSGWVDLVRGSEPFRQAAMDGRVQIIHADLGPTKKWGYPVNVVSHIQAAGYHTVPWLEATTSFTSDRRVLVLVDGRYRVACALNVALWSGSGYLVVDDVTDRPHLERLASLIPGGERLGRAMAWQLPVDSADVDRLGKVLRQASLDPR